MGDHGLENDNLAKLECLLPPEHGEENLYPTITPSIPSG
jgi:hypothetical protein